MSFPLVSIAIASILLGRTRILRGPQLVIDIAGRGDMIANINPKNLARVQAYATPARYTVSPSTLEREATCREPDSNEETD